MVIKATIKQNELIMNYLSEEAGINLFIIGDIENFGYDNQNQDIWIDLEQEHIHWILLRYYDSLIFYSKEVITDYSKVIELIQNNSHRVISGKKEIIDPLVSKLTQHYKQKPTFFMEIKELKHRDNYSDLPWKVGQIEDAEAQYNLSYSIDEFRELMSEKEQYMERYKNKINNHHGKTYMIKENDVAIASVSTTAENSKSAMVVSVMTHKEHRNKGYASKLMTKLCEDYLSENKTLCLFYENPKAGSIYRRLGFEDIGIWTMNILQSE